MVGKRESLAASRRLRKLRMAAGFSTATEAAVAMGVSPGTYYHHESGIRPVTRAAALRYGKFFAVPAGAILFGERLQVARSIPIVAVLGNDGRITPTPAAPGEPQGDGSMASRHPPRPVTAMRVQPPPGFNSPDQLLAVRVEATTFAPQFNLGDVIFIEAPRPDAGIDRRRVNGRICMVGISEDETVLARVLCNPDGGYSLVQSSAPGPSRAIVNPVFVALVRGVWFPDIDDE